MILLLALPALAQAAMVTGSYTGDGQPDRTIGGLGFEPAVVIIKGDVARSAIVRTGSMPAGQAKQLAQEQPLLSDRILGTTGDGFRVGSDQDVNAAGSTYWYVAFATAAGSLVQGSYAGDGADDRTITGLGLDPGLVILIPGNSARCRFRTAPMPAGQSLPFDDVPLQDGVLTGLQADGFGVGADWRANEAGTTYHYLAVASGDATASWGAYVGDGTANRVITGSGFQPRWVVAKSAESKPGLHLPRELSDQGGSLNFRPEANLAGGLLRMVGQGFVVDGHERVNEDGKTIYWAAFTSSDDLADVSVQLAADPDPVELAALTTVTATIANAGPQTATGATLTVDLPAGVALESTVADPGVITDGSTPTRVSLAWDIPPGEQRQVALGLRIERGSATRTLAAGAVSHLADPATADNTATLELSVPSADLALSLAAAPPDPVAGDTATVSVALTNLGPDTALAAEVVPALPAGLTLISAAPGAGDWDGDAGRWTLASLPAGDTVVLDLAARVEADQAGATLPVTASATTARNDPDAGNDDATAALHVQATVPVIVTAVPFAAEHRVLLPGGPTEAVLRLRLRNGGGAPAVLDSLTLTNALTGAADQDAQDAVWRDLALRDADGALLGAGAFSDGRLAMGALGLELAAGDSLDLVLHGGAHLDAPDGLRLQPELPGGGAVFADPVLVHGDWPLTAPGTLTVDGMTAAQIGRHPVGEGIFQMGSARNLALDVTVPANGGQPDLLTKLNVVNLGSATPRTVVTRVEAWADDGDGRFDPAVDPRIGELHWTGGQRFEASALAMPIPAAGLRVMVTVDVAEAALGGTVQLSLPAGDDPAIGVASGNDGPVDMPVINPYTQTISATDKVVVTTAAILGRTVAPGEAHVPLLHLLARNLYDQPRTLQQLRVRNLTGGAPGGDQADRDAAISRVTLRRDGNGNGVLDDPDTDPVLLATTFEDGVATFTGMRWQLAPDAVAHLFVTGHVDTLDAADGDTLAAAIGAGSDVQFEEPSALVGDWPLSSGGRHPVDGMVAAQVRCPAVPPVSLTAGEGPVLALDLTIPGNGWQADTLADLRLRNEGGAVPGDIAELALWDDTDGDGVFEPATDQPLATLTGIGADWVALDLDLDVPAGGRRLFAGLTVAETPTDSATVRLAVPTGGLQMTSANDGPRDGPVVSPTALLISTAPLLSNVAFTADRSTTEMTVQAVMTVQNVGGETVQDIVPHDVAVTGDGSLSLVASAQPPSLGLAPGATGTFTWTFAGESTGPVFLTARCQGTSAVGGQTRGSLATASAAHTVLAPATDLGLYPVANMPFSINRGQTGVVPLTLTLLNDGGPDRAELRLERLAVTLDDGEGLPVVPAALLSRVTVNEGVNVYCDRTDLETTGSTLTLDLDPAVVVTPFEPVTLGLRLDIAEDTAVPRFRVGLESPDDLATCDHVSGAARTVTLVEGQFPVRSAAGTIVAQATGLQVTAAPSSPCTAGPGQDGVPLLALQLTATGPDQGSEVRVGGFAVAITDTLGNRLADAASRLAQISVQGPLATHAVENLTAPDDSVVTFTLSPQVTVPVGAGAVSLHLDGRIAADPVLGPLQMHLEPVDAFDARDANVGAAVPVSYQPDRPAGPTVTVQDAAPALLLGGRGLLPPVISQGARDVPALSVTVAHPGDAGAAAARMDTLRIVCLDGAREPLDPDVILDGFQARWDGTPLMADAIHGDSALVVPLGGRLLASGTQVELSVSVDVEADAPATALEFLVQPGSLIAADANLGTALGVEAPAGATLPVSSRLSSIQPAAEEVTVAWTDRLPAWLPADGSAAEALVLDLRNPAAAGSAPAELASLTLRASDRHGRTLAAGALLAAATARAGDQDWAGDQAVTTDSTLTLTGGEPLRLPAGETIRLSLRVTPRAGAGPDGLRLQLHAGDLVCTQPGSSTPVPVRPTAGQAFPVRTAAAGVAATDLAGSYVNYPNPFAAGRGSTDFAFQLAGPATVSLRIWTPRGEAVIDLLREDDRAAGLHQDVRWDGRNGRGHVVRNGVYLAELTVRYGDGNRERLLRKVAVVR